MNKICIGLSIFFAILSNVLIRIVSKNTEKYTLPRSVSDNFLESLGMIFLSFSFSLVDCLHISLDCFLIFLVTVVIMFIICFIVRKVSENEKLGKYWTEINKIE